jgi:hypothetical protein
MPQILIRDMRKFGDGLMRSKMFVDQVIVWISEERKLSLALADANMQIRQRDTAVRLYIEVLMSMHQPEEDWFLILKSKIKGFTRGAEPMVEVEENTRYTWDMHNVHGEQFSIEVVFRGATDGNPDFEDVISPEPTEIQDDPDGVGGGSLDG